MPKRLQRSRRKGWRMPPGAVYVGRPTKWGNPYRSVGFMTKAEAVELYRRKVLHSTRCKIGPREIRRELRGKDLVCWCKPGEPCHADVLLEIANR